MQRGTEGAVGVWWLDHDSKTPKMGYKAGYAWTSSAAPKRVKARTLSALIKAETLVVPDHSEGVEEESDA